MLSPARKTLRPVSLPHWVHPTLTHTPVSWRNEAAGGTKPCLLQGGSWFWGVLSSALCLPVGLEHKVKVWSAGWGAELGVELSTAAPRDWTQPQPPGDFASLSCSH